MSDFCDSMDYSLLTSSVHGISQARILERVAVSSSRGSSQPRIKPASLMSSALASEFFTTSAPWEALESRWFCRKLNLSVTEDLGGIIYFSLQIIYLKITADGDCSHEIKKTLTPWKESYDQPRQHIKKQRHYFDDKGPYSQSYGFSSSHVWM